MASLLDNILIFRTMIPMKTLPLKGPVASLFRSILRKMAPLIHEELQRFEKAYDRQWGESLLSHCQSHGEGISFGGRVRITAPRYTCLGNNLHLGAGCHFSTEGGLTVGDNTHIADSVVIETSLPLFEGRRLPFEERREKKRVRVGRNVFIGHGAMIKPGVSVGDGAIVHSGTVVRTDVAPMSVVDPASGVSGGSRSREIYEKLDGARQYADRAGRSLHRDGTAPLPPHGPEASGRLFFVVSSGRSGSMTLAELLDQHSQIHCRHEPRPQLIRLSTEFAHGAVSAEELNAELTAIFCESGVFREGSLYGESDQKYWNLVPFVAELLPEARFAWLIRDGRRAVPSGCARGWFRDDEALFRLEEDHSAAALPLLHDHCVFRLDGARCGAVSEEEWRSMGQWEKNCWYWGHVNTAIGRSMKDLPGPRWKIIRLESIEECRDGLLSWLGVKPEQLRVDACNKGPQNIPFENRPEEEKRCFEKWCGPAMDELYPDWRNA